MPTFASSSRAQLYYIKEGAYGTTPSSGNGRKLRMTGESLDMTRVKEASKEMRDDRQVSGATTVDAQAAGGFNFHAQYAEYDQLIEGALQSTFTVFGTNGVSSATFTATLATGTITASSAPTGNNAFTNLAKGQWFLFNCSGDDNDLKLFRVDPATAPTTTVITLDSSTPAIASVGATGCTIATSRLSNGVTQPSFTLEKGFGDVTQFIAYTGMTVGKMSLTLTAAGQTDGSFDFLGKNGLRADATVMPGTVTASNTYEIHNAVTGIGQLWEAGAPITGTYVKMLGVEVDNSLRGQKALQNLGNVGIGSGDFSCKGKLSVYFSNGALYDKFANDTYTSLVVSTQDLAKNGYVFSMPRVLLMNGKITAGSKNADVMVEFDYEAFSDDANATAALRKTLFIDRVGAAVA